MEEELNENELEERLYAMIHHVDQTQNNLIDSYQNNVTQFADNSSRSTVRRYWRLGTDTNPYQKINYSKDAAVAKIIKEPAVSSVTKTTKDLALSNVAKNAKDPIVSNVAKVTSMPDDATLKEERRPAKPPSPINLSVFQSPVPQNAKKTIEIIEHEVNNPVVLESSDEDEVVEVALPPKPTITIESSDEDELHIVKQNSPQRTESKSNSGDRAVSASPVPSVVSSVSDEFIRGDCIALNISSRHPDKHSFDFSLHGSDLIDQTNASSKKKKRKKNKEAVTSTPIVAENPNNVPDSCFATPKSKAKNRKQKGKRLNEKSVPISDVYDSDSSQSAMITNNKNPYIVTEKSLPSVDVYESDSNQSEIVREINTDQTKEKVVETHCSDSTVSDDKQNNLTSKIISQLDASKTIDLTENENHITLDNTGITDSIVIANVTGFAESMDYGDEDIRQNRDISKYVSSKVPSILYENLDFDNLKGNEKIYKRRRYSLTTLRAEMEKFYNESWGGEEFNHKEIQKNMSRDKSLWAIDPKDRMQSMAQRKTRCGYCNRTGHRDDACHQRPAVCHMCGNQGHYEPRCPAKICVNCGAPNFMYSTMCRKCSTWPRMTCAECGQAGHPASHCPDLWRRYHNTISLESALEECGAWKKPSQQYCSGCARRGHLVHACRVTLPFSGLPLHSPRVQLYRPLYRAQRSKSCSEGKRASRSPPRDAQPAKKRLSENTDDASLQKKDEPKNRKITNKGAECAPPEPADTESASNRDRQGRVIQHNEVSDTSDAVSSARLYVPAELSARLLAAPGRAWLAAQCARLQLSAAPPGDCWLAVSGRLADQEAFQAELRAWARVPDAAPTAAPAAAPAAPATAPAAAPDHRAADSPAPAAAAPVNVPRSKTTLLNYIDEALNSLDQYFGDPGTLYENLIQSQKEHEKLLRQKVVNPVRLAHSRSRINGLLRQLNIMLLGQAGLAGGAGHVGGLRACRRQLGACPDATVALPLRRAVSEHYDAVFAATARDDYDRLVKKYYGMAGKLAKKRKRLRAKRRAAASTQPAAPAAAPEPEPEPAPAPAPEHVTAPATATASTDKQTVDPTPKHYKQLKELVSFTNKLKSLRNSGTCSHEAKWELSQLMRRIHPCIAMLHRNKQINSKQTKKMRKVQLHARRFLAGM